MSELDKALITFVISGLIAGMVSVYLARRQQRKRGMPGEHNDPDKGTKTDVSIDL